MIELVKHGLSNTRLYSIWYQMKRRCSDTKCNKYAIYGGRGITVCEEWMDFINFYEWALANGYKETLTIDRIDGNGNYEPSNCRWVTVTEQNRNKCNTKYCTFNETTKPLVEWAEEVGMNDGTLRSRLERGWDMKRAMTEQVKTPHRKEVTEVKKFMTVPDYCKVTGFPEKRLRELCHSNNAHKFCHRFGERGHFLLDTERFERLWNRGVLGE